jgi:hypothetical protein
MRDVDLAYLAGVVDSDGFITIHRKTKASKYTGQSATYHWLRAGISGSQTQPHELALSLFGGGISRHTPKVERFRTQCQWAVYGDNAARFLAAISPYLRVKLQQAVLGHRFQQSFGSLLFHEREEFWKAMASLNKPTNLRSNKEAAGRTLDGKVWDEFPKVQS